MKCVTHEDREVREKIIAFRTKTVRNTIRYLYFSYWVKAVSY